MKGNDKMNESDERYTTAEDAICDAFFLLLKEKDMDKITVSDIVKKARIVRSTFYNHYENIPALLMSAEDKALNDIFNIMEDFHPKNDKEMCKSFFLAICNYIENNPFLVILLQSPRGDEFFAKAMTMFHRYVGHISENKSPAPQSMQRFKFFVASTIGCTLGVLHKWTSEKLSTPAEEVADIMAQVFISGILPYLSE